jgi:Xaa-Pro aminopeptidase
VSVLTSLTSVMAAQGIDALIIPRADEFLGEYIPAANERLHYVSEFTGSAGLCVVTQARAAVFVDGRYTVQVKQQVDTRWFDINPLSDHALGDWLQSNVSESGVIGIDARTISREQMQRWQERWPQFQWQDTQGNLVDSVWVDRPPVVALSGRGLDERYAGESSLSKRQRLGDTLKKQGLDGYWVFLPESVSWLLNVRGRDIPQLPILQSHALLASNGDVLWFVESDRLPENWQEICDSGITVVAPSELSSTLAQWTGRTVGADPANTNAASWSALVEAGITVQASDCPLMSAKARKNSIEVDGARRAHLRDAVAKSQFLTWIDKTVSHGVLPTEAELADQLHQFRAAHSDFIEPSFSTISAAGPNAALCHYNHRTAAAPARLTMNSLYLVDSGGQYLDGTTDVTRTVAIGKPSDEMRKHFTLVLKGHIALARIRFPRGTSGMQLDPLARQYLWQHELDFEHGTGHGVGSYLSVHEGPQRIAKLGSPVPLEIGMIVSNEPGYYAENEYGIRCENLQVVVPADSEGYLQFETLTLLPFDQRLIDVDLLTATEKAWLDAYHERVNSALQPLVPSDCQGWLAHVTRPLERSE